MIGAKQMSFEASFKALSDPVRREILQMLKDGRLSAGEISRHFDMTAATVSYHLNILKKAGLVWEEKEKNFIYYDLNTSILEELMSWLIELEGSRKNEE
ncbi:putative ArsR family transcriptional regulator [Tetragenococcus halophilus NBRC 12172]|uniref:ArsR family transcriptional regulator n=3 Tax=Tetragenococcus halophilus TaxID=51669 RepID=A0AAN1VT69_TETHN|nr:putative ArsR family transcriptional regulator [Tetragenococcus halophilus NBRC 12172]